MKSIIKTIKLNSGLGFKGGIEGVSHGIAFGWAVSKVDPSKPAHIEILIDGVVIGSTIADRCRADIAAAAPIGYRCGFNFNLLPYLPKLAGQKLTIREKGMVTSGNTPIELYPHSGWGALDGITGLAVSGWVVFAKNELQNFVEILVDNQVAGTAKVEGQRLDLLKAGAPTAKCGFKFAIPTRWHDGLVHTIQVRPLGSNSFLRGSGAEFSATLQGHVDIFDKSKVTGWLVNLNAKDTPIRFDLVVNGKLIKHDLVANLIRDDVEMSLFGTRSNTPLGFYIEMPADLKWEAKFNSVTLCLPGTMDNLLKFTATAVDRYELLTLIENLSSYRHIHAVSGNNGGLQNKATLVLNAALRTELLPKVIQLLRSVPIETPLLLNQYKSQQAGLKEKSLPDEMPVDVIIPVYKGYHETLDCINSVLATRNGVAMEVVVINDRSPDSRLSAELRKLAAKEHFTLIENEKNIGFVATVNKGMKLHPNRDVLLLNSDTLVPKGWLAAMRRAAYAAPNIGTVTPFSNRATIFSLPRTCIDNDMPLGMNVEQVNTLCAQLNPGVIIDVPTAMGFCMYIRRETLDEVGYFDEEKWAKGYGEENDFCIRAIGMGWRNVAACDVFVQHHGSVSFDTEKAPRVAENLAKLHAMYPDYPERINRYLKADPIAAPRGRVNAALLKQLSAGYILFVTHGLGGGTETAIRNLIKIHSASGKNALILRSAPSGKLLLSPAISIREKELVTEYPHETHVDLLAEHLRELKIEYVHFHHTLGFKPDIWRLPELLGIPYDVMIHDFYLACPRINMIDESGSYCGQPDIAACERCIKGLPLDHDAEERLGEVGGSVVQWRQFHMDQLRGARHIVTPSQSARTHIQRYLPVQHIEAIPHPEPAYTFKPREWNGSLPYRIAVLGAIGPHKGSSLLLACAKYALRENLPLHFIVIGYTNCDDAFAELDNVEITGAYDPEELPSLVENLDCTTALFLSVWPETFSYTLSEAWRLGLYPISLDIGAPAERIRETGMGALIPFTQNPKEIVETLLSTLNSQKTDYDSVLQSQISSAEPCEL